MILLVVSFHLCKMKNVLDYNLAAVSTTSEVLSYRGVLLEKPANR